MIDAQDELREVVRQKDAELSSLQAAVRRLESQHATMSAAIDAYVSRERQNEALLEELRMKYEAVKKNYKAITEQNRILRDQLLRRHCEDAAAATGTAEGDHGDELKGLDVETTGSRDERPAVDDMDDHVFEADIRHLELCSSTTTAAVQRDSSAEVRIKELESEKEVLARMLEKLSSLLHARR